MLDYYRFKAVSDLFLLGEKEEARLELAELQRRYVSLCDENSTLKMQIQEYQDILYIARNLVLESEFYWLQTGSVRQGPFCPACYDNDGLLMRLSDSSGERFCTTCRTGFYKEPETRIRVAASGRNLTDTDNTPAMRTLPRKAKVILFSK